jgi:hypothetical protein
LVIAIYGILRNERYDPYSKLLALRFVRDALGWPSSWFLPLASSVLTDTLLEAAMFRKSSQDEERGQEFFFLAQGTAAYTEVHLRTVGLSYHKIVLEMYEAMAEAVPTCPCNSTMTIPSRFLEHFRLMKSVGVKFPCSRTYYKPK